MDRRQRRSRKAIFSAFEDLLLEDHYRTITVAKIIERADIGRSTFYAHFATKDELLDQMCTEMFSHVFDGVETDAHTHEALETTTIEGILTHLLYHVRDNHHGVCGKLLAEGEPLFTARFYAALNHFFEHRLPERSSWVPRDLMHALLVSSFSEAISWWHRTGYKSAPEQLAHWYTRTLGWKTSAAPHAAEVSEESAV